MPRQSTNKLILLAIIFLGIALGYMYTIYYTEAVALAPVSATSKVSVSGLTELISKIRWDITDGSDFKSLKQFGESPVEPGVTGNRDIFAPI